MNHKNDNLTVGKGVSIKTFSHPFSLDSVIFKRTAELAFPLWLQSSLAVDDL